jgi:hypothetical protein
MKVQLLTMGWLLVGVPLAGWAGAATGAFLGSLALLLGGLYWFVSNFERRSAMAATVCGTMWAPSSSVAAP